ncbi:MAG: protease modulator HflC [Planctomycetota bacterium]|jgi:membrane protease subunit HflC
MNDLSSSSPATSTDDARQPDSTAGRSLLSVLAAVILVAWLTTCVLFVDESEVVVVERLGTITAVLDQPEQRGLNFKLPWPIGTARRFDRRIQLFDPPGREVFTRDRKNVTVDAYVCWKIAETSTPSSAIAERPAVQFFRSLGSLPAAQARLETRVRSAIATRLAEVELTDLMAVTDSESQAATDVSLTTLAASLLTDVRQRNDELQSVTDRLGIEIVDVRIKRINFPLGNQQAVFERMKSERQKIADRYRSAGLAQNTVIRSQADRQYAEIMSKADAEAERIRGEAEAEALKILNAAHARDPEFYRQMRTFDAYRDILNEKTTLVLSADNSLLRQLVEKQPADSHQQAGTAASDQTIGPDTTQADDDGASSGARQKSESQGSQR